MRALLISGMECDNRLVEEINSLNFEYIIGLGDIECPQYIKNFYGIIGEAESVFVLKWLMENGKLLVKLNEISSDFSTDIVIAHYPPNYVGRVANVPIGSSEVYKNVLLYEPKILIHGHSENIGISKIGKTKVISIGLIRDRNYAIYENGNIFLSR